jgi:hypothetical protein
LQQCPVSGRNSPSLAIFTAAAVAYQTKVKEKTDPSRKEMEKK